MPVRIGFLGVAHMHSYGYAEALRLNKNAEFIGVWDENGNKAGQFVSARRGVTYKSPESLLADVDAVIICSENKKHAEYGEWAAAAGKHILCEKPLVTTEEEGERFMSAIDKSGVKLMTAFPCRYSPAFQRLKEKISAGEIGSISAICSTNRGRCPFDWFVDEKRSGGGAMIDHTVHVADLLRDLLKSEVVGVQAQTGNNMYGKDWEDTAMLTLEFANGVFATLDSSWSRPKSYKTWGDVTMNVVGEKGVIELDMFGQNLDLHLDSTMQHTVAWFGSDLDTLLIADFVNCIQNDTPPPITGFDGLQASRVAIAGYKSSAEGQPISI